MFCQLLEVFIGIRNELLIYNAEKIGNTEIKAAKPSANRKL